MQLAVFPSRARGIALVSDSVYPFESLFVLCPRARARSLSVSQQFLKVTAVPGARSGVCGAASSLRFSSFLRCLSLQLALRRSALGPASQAAPLSPRPCGIPLETFRYSYLPATTSKIPSSPPLDPREFSLSYKGFAATYNISPPPFPCHFALSASTLSNLSRPSPPVRHPLSFFSLSASLPLPARHHRRSKGPSSPFLWHSPSCSRPPSSPPQPWSSFPRRVLRADLD